MESFDPNAAAALESGIFGLPFSEQESALVLLPIPWEATTSYGRGTALGPAAMLAASHQLDLFDLEIESPYAAGIFMAPEASEVLEWNQQACAMARPVIEAGGPGTIRSCNVSPSRSHGSANRSTCLFAKPRSDDWRAERSLES